MSELTPRQWVLYNYLKDRGDKWTTQLTAAIDISFTTELGFYDEWDKSFHDSTARLQMTKDIRAINNSSVIQKMIIVSNKGIKLATKEEAQKFIKSKYAAIFRQLQRARKLERKAGLDGQMRIVFGSEREIVQAFTDSNTTGERWRFARKLAGLSQKQAVALMSQYIHIDEPLLSRIENGVCLPNSEQAAAFEKVYR